MPIYPIYIVRWFCVLIRVVALPVYKNLIYLYRSQTKDRKILSEKLRNVFWQHSVFSVNLRINRG
jgi:hypothetical protein